MRFAAGPLQRRIQSPSTILMVGLLYRLTVATNFFRIGGVTYQWTNEIAAIARSLVLHHSFAGPYAGYAGPTAWMAPIYPFLTAAVFWVFGIDRPISGIVLLLLNCIFSSVTSLLIYRLGQEYLTEQTGLIAAWAFALSPVVVLMPLLLWDTSLSAMMFSLSFLVLLRATSVRGWAGAGALWGLSALVSPALLAPLPFILISKLLGFRTRVKFAIFFCLTLGLVLLPWFLRNRRVMHANFPVRSNGWAEIYFGNVTFDLHPCARSNGLYQQIGETRFVQQMRDEAIQYIRHQPLDFAWKSLLRWFRFWFVPLSVLPLTAFLAISSWAGAFLLLRNSGAMAIPLVAVPVFYPIIYSITHVETRYRHPMEPFQYLLASYCASLVMNFYKKGQRSRRSLKRHGTQASTKDYIPGAGSGTGNGCTSGAGAGSGVGPGDSGPGDGSGSVGIPGYPGMGFGARKTGITHRWARFISNCSHALRIP